MNYLSYYIDNCSYEKPEYKESLVKAFTSHTISSLNPPGSLSGRVLQI
jgi:hypothetical protein